MKDCTKTQEWTRDNRCGVCEACCELQAKAFDDGESEYVARLRRRYMDTLDQDYETNLMLSVYAIDEAEAETVWAKNKHTRERIDHELAAMGYTPMCER